MRKVNKDNEVLGTILRKIRKEKKVTLKELAKKIDVSVSFISQIENNKTSPSLYTLKKIADELNTTVGKLIGETYSRSSGKELICRKKDRKFLKGIGPGVKISILTKSEQFKLMEPLLNKLEKRANSGETMYRHFGQEFGYIIKGKLEIMLADKKYILNEGDSIYFDSNIPHYFKNIHKGITEMIWVVTPPSF